MNLYKKIYWHIIVCLGLTPFILFSMDIIFLISVTLLCLYLLSLLFFIGKYKDKKRNFLLLIYPGLLVIYSILSILGD